MADDYTADDFREDWFNDHHHEDSDLAERLWDELRLMDIMQESASLEDFGERMHAIYDETGDEYDARWHELMDEFLDLLGIDIEDLAEEGWYH